MTESDDDDLIPQTSVEIAQRTLALIAVVDRAHNEDPEQLLNWVNKNSITDYFSDAEREFYNENEPSSQEITNFKWRAEALVPLLWSLSRLPELPPLNSQIDWSKIESLSKILSNPTEFIQTAELRAIEEVNELGSCL